MAQRKKTPDIMGELLGGQEEDQRPEEAGTPERQPASVPAKPSSDEKTKATYYLSESTVDALEEAWLKLRRMADSDARKQISKSLIVDAALQIALVDLEENGEVSRLASVLVSQ